MTQGMSQLQVATRKCKRDPFKGCTKPRPHTTRPCGPAYWPLGEAPVCVATPLPNTLTQLC